MEQQMENRPGLNEKSGLFMLIGLMGVGFMVGGFLSFFVWKLMTGQGMADMQLSMSNPAFANQVRVTQTLLSLCIFLFPACSCLLPMISGRIRCGFLMRGGRSRH